MNNKRIINVRILFVSLVAVICGILFSYLIVKGINLHTFSYYTFPIIALVVFDLFCLVLKLIKSDKEWVARINKYFASSVAFLLLFVVGFGVTTLKLSKYLNLSSYNAEYEVSVVAENVYKYDSYLTITARSFSVDGNVIKESTSVTVYYDHDTQYGNIKAGDRLTFTGSASLTPLFSNTSNLVDYLYGRAYSVQVNYEDINFSTAKVSADATIRQHVFNILSSKLSQDNAGVAYTMLFGDKEHLSSSISQMFNYAGISHILAVSGLHVGMLAGIIAWILKRLKVRRFVNLIVVFIILLIYCWLCGFAPSVVRASIMSVIMLIAFVSAKEYDVLSSLSLAAIITLVINPLQLFAIGFQLSYLCILSIITLSNTISRTLKKLRLPQIICNTLALSTCINIVIMPVCVNAFSKVSLMGALANIIVLPLFGVLFPVLFVTTFISAIMPFMSFMLFLPDVLLHFLKIVANFFASINFANFKMYNISYLVLIGIILLLLIIKYLMLGRKLKALTIVAVCLLIVTSFAFSMISTSYSNVLALSYQYRSNSAVITIDGSNYLIGTNNNYIDSMLKKLKIRKIDYIICYDILSNQIDRFNSVCAEYKVKAAYIPTNTSDAVNNAIVCSTIKQDTFTAGQYNFEFVYSSLDKCIGLVVKADKCAVFANSNNSSDDNIQLANNVLNFDYFICNRCNISEYATGDAVVIVYNDGTYNQVDLYEQDKYIIKV